MTITEQIAFICKHHEAALHGQRAGWAAILSTLRVAEKKELKTKLPATLPVSNWNEWVGAYKAFYKKRNDCDLVVTGAEGKILKEIVLRILAMKPDNSEQHARNGWLYILDNWDLLPCFLRRQVALKDISRNLLEIINFFKNERQKNKPSNNTTNAASALRNAANHLLDT